MSDGALFETDEMAVWDDGSTLTVFGGDVIGTPLSAEEVHRLSVALSLWLAKQDKTTR